MNILGARTFGRPPSTLHAPFERNPQGPARMDRFSVFRAGSHVLGGSFQDLVLVNNTLSNYGYFLSPKGRVVGPLPNVTENCR